MEKRKPSIPQFKAWKEQGRKIRMATAYDFSFASLVERSPIEMILVGDSLGMVMLGYDSTVPVTMEDMVHHTKPVVRGAANTFIVADMPFGSYNVSLSETMRLRQAWAGGTRLSPARDTRARTASKCSAPGSRRAMMAGS